jgi:hypothetical protein
MVKGLLLTNRWRCSTGNIEGVYTKPRQANIALLCTLSTSHQTNSLCSGQVILATVLESFQYKRSDSFGVNPPLY